MATVEQLAARAHREIAYLLVVEGWPWAFTDRHEIAGTGPGSWIGTDYGDRREVLEGLTVPESISYAVSLENGMLTSEDGATFTVRDFDRKIISLLDLTNEGEEIGQTLGPKDDPAPALVLDGTGQGNVSPWGKWVNHEAIGPAGERRYFSCMPVSLPGGDHAAVTQEGVPTLPSILRDQPTWHEGVRCALYAIYRDIDTGLWPSWQEQHDSGSSLLWFGSTSELAAQSLTWTLECDGPSSWLRRQLGGNRSAEWQKLSAPIKLSQKPGAREDLSAYLFEYRTSTAVETGASSYYNVVDDVLPQTGVAANYRAAIGARLAVVAGTAGPDTTWSAPPPGGRNASCAFTQKQITMMVDASGYAALAYVCLHEKVWRCLGYDPRVQAGTGASGDDPLIIDFVPAKDVSDNLEGFNGEQGPGYWLARLSTIPKQYFSVIDAGPYADNAGKPRVYQAIMGEDAVTLDPKGDQEVLVGGGVYMEGQLCRAPAEHTMLGSGEAVDATGFIAVRGSMRTSVDGEIQKIAAVAKVGWVDHTDFGGHGIPLIDLGLNNLWIERYIDARLFGIAHTMDRQWSSFDAKWVPVNFLGSSLHVGDRVDLMLLRTMLSTGTCSWVGYDNQGAVRTLGVNAHPDADADRGSDAEIADLGLAIPWSLIDAKSFTNAANQLPQGGKNSPLNHGKFAFIGGFDSQDFIWRVLEQRGWGMGFVGARFRLFSRPQLLDLEDVELTIGPGDLATDDIHFVEQAVLRATLPRDEFVMMYGKPLVDGTGAAEEMGARVRSAHVHARTRRTNNVETFDNGLGLVPVDLWPEGDGDPPPPADWRKAWAELAGGLLGEWYAAPWIVVEVPVLWNKARLLGPGSVVSFSSLYAPNRAGGYGLTDQIGRVVSVSIDLERLTAQVRVMLQPGDPKALRRFAPMAWVVDDVATVEERHDAATQRIFCYQDALDHGEDAHDVAWFAEPSWSTVGGQARVDGWQFDGRTWSNTFSFSVASVDTVNDSITYTNFTGKFWEARETILVLAKYDDQDVGSWPRSLFVVITRSDGKFGIGPTQGFKLVK